MKRSPTHPQTLKHLPFFEVLAEVPEGSDAAKLATAGLLSLRMIDHWVLAGPAIVEPESVSVRSVRQAIMALPPKEPVREALLTVVNTMQMLRMVDLVPVLPRVFAYAQLLDRHHGALALAADTYESVIRLADIDHDVQLVMDSLQFLAATWRKLGNLEDAEESSRALVKLATRYKDKAHVLRGRIGLGQVALLRGDLAAADSLFAGVAAEAEKLDLTVEFAMSTHNRGAVALRAGRPADAVVLAHRALKKTADPMERDRVLGDLAAFLIKLEQYDSAADALRILEVTAVTEEPRQAAKINLLAVAARIGDRKMFDAARESLAGASLPMDFHVNMLIETARGLDAFGDSEAANAVLARAASTASAHGLQRATAEVEALYRAGFWAQAHRTTDVVRENDQTAEVADDLRRMAMAYVLAR